VSDQSNNTFPQGRQGIKAAGYQVMPEMPPEQFQALKDDIAERGVLVPIDVDEHGNILDGHHRHRACSELGITDVPTIVRPGMTEEERRMFARKSNMLRRHLSRAQVRHLIAEQMRDTPNWANNRIAKELGTDKNTVALVREELERTCEIPKFERLIGADGKERPTKQPRRPAIMASDLDELHRILARIAEGADLNDLAGFASEQKFAAMTMVDRHYDPFHGRSEDERREWLLFTLFLGGGESSHRHVEWLLQRPFQNVGEWMGAEGDRYRKIYQMRTSLESKKAWHEFAEEHRDRSLESVSDELAQLYKERPVEWVGERPKARRRKANQ
jgi:hypothetical protein